MRKIYLPLLLVAAMLLSHISYSQDFSNKGKEFWLVFPAHVPSSGQAQMGLFITSDQNSAGTISCNGWSTTFTVTANQITGPINVPYANANVTAGESGLVVNKGIHVTTNPGQPPVVLYAHIYAGFRSEASLILPITALGKQYFSTNFWQASTNSSKSQFQIIATEPNTTVEYQLRRNGTLDPNVITRTLDNVGDVLQIQDDQDLTGSRIESIAGAGGCKRIAVFSGSSALAIHESACTGNSYDPLYQQCYPINTWGKNFGITPMPPYNPSTLKYQNYHLRVMASEDNTIVNFDGTNVTLNKGQCYPAIASNPTSFNAAKVISANKPIAVAQYLLSAVCAGTQSYGNPPQAQGDPDMIILNPVEQNIADINIFSSNLQNIHKKFLCVYMKTNDAPTFRINGNLPTTAFTPMPQNNGYSYLLEELTNYATQSFRLKADSGFNAITFGIGDAESYGYSAGTNVRDFYQFMTVNNQYATVNFPASCINQPFNIYITLPYQPTQLNWDLSGIGYPNVIQNPTPNVQGPTGYDSTWLLNDKTLYRYKLPLQYTMFATGTFPIQVIAQNPTADGCNAEQTIDFSLQVFPKPNTDFSFTNGCTNAPVSFTGLPTNTSNRPIASHYWTFGDGGTATIQNPTHTFPGPNSWNVGYTIITDVGCKSDTTFKPVIIAPPPVPAFGISTIHCVGQAINFFDQTNPAPNVTITEWIWDFGDGSPVVSAANGNPQQHTYATPGTYTATLKVKTASGCFSNPTPVTVVVGPKPVASFNFGGACLPSGATQFTDNSTISDGTQALFTYAWTFGDGGTSNVASPNHTYATSGPFNVTLTVTSNNGCIDDSTRVMDQVYAEPTANFNITGSNEACLGAAVNFTDASNAPNSTPNEWHWDFGDGGTSTLQNPSHTYTTAGTYNVTLWIKSAAGCVSQLSAAKQVIVNPLPTVSFTVSNPVCESGNVLFTSTSTPGAGNITTYAWTINTAAQGGNTNTLNYSPTTAGTINVGLTVTTDKGCTNQTTQAVTVNPKPVANFNPPAICLPSGLGVFQSTSTIADNSPLTYAWDFGDGGTAGNTPNPSHIYAGVGPYTVTLTVTSNNGCVSTKQQVPTIYAQPVAAFNAPAEVCLGAQASFQDNSTAASSTVTQWNWNFGDGNTSTQQNPTHTYATAGSYNVTLSVGSGAGCPSAVSAPKVVVVNPLPTAGFTISNPRCQNKVVSFNDASIPNAGNLNTWTWDFGDGGNSNTQNPTHTYTATGNYNVTLQVKTDKGCTSTLAPQTVTVSPVPSVNFTSSITCVLDPFMQFTDGSSIADGSQAQFTYAWTFGDGGTGTGANPQHQYTLAGPYNVTVTVTSNAGCTNNITKPVFVNGDPPKPGFDYTAGSNNFCSGNSITIANKSTVALGNVVKVEVFWDYTNDPTIKTVDNTPATGNTYSHSYPAFTSPATKTVTVHYVAYSGQTCLRSADSIITLHATPDVDFSPVAGICKDVPAFQITQANALNDAILNGTGVFSGNGVSATGIFDPNAAGVGSHTIKYVYTSPAGCKDSAEQVIKVFALPVVDAGPRRGMIENGSIQLLATASGNNLTYVWTPNTRIDNPTILRPRVNPVSEQLYKLEATSADGCKASDTVTVFILKNIVIPNIFSPNGDGVHDKWVVDYLDSYPGCTVDIYNRYGQLIFHSLGYDTPWDGKVNGKDVPVGTYYYIIDPKNGRTKVSGYVDVIR